MSRRTKHLLCCTLLSLATACATNALRIEAASDVAERGRATAAASRTFLSEVERERYAINADIIAADPACRDPRATFRQPPMLASVANPLNPPRGWLCEPLRPSENRAHALMLGSIGGEFAPTLRLVQSLADYSAAMTKILETPAPQPVADIENALQTARSAEALLNALAARSDTLVPAADDERLSALTGFISFLSELRHEAVTVERLRQLRRETGGGATVIAALSDHLANWEQSRSASEDFGVRLADSMLSVATRPGSPATAELRRNLASDYYTRIRTQTASGQLSDALQIALRALSEAETEYDQLLQEHARLNPEQRARRASIIRQRLTRAFDLATSLITSFRG